MRKLLLLLALALPLFSAQVPRKSGEFVIQLPDGSQKLLSAYKGKTVVLALMYTTCPHCQKMVGVLADVQKEYAARGVQVLGATFDTGAKDRIVQFNTQFGANFPCGVSNQQAVLDYLQIPQGTPYFVPIMVFIDKNGNVRDQYVGDEEFLSNPPANIRAELTKIMAAGGAPAAAKKAPATQPK